MFFLLQTSLWPSLLSNAGSGGRGHWPSQLPHLPKERTFPDIKCSLAGDVLCVVAFCAEGEGMMQPDFRAKIRTLGAWGGRGHTPATLVVLTLGSARLDQSPTPPQLNPKPSAVRLISSGLEGSCCPCC